jgi:hypothetical protein
MSHRLISAAAVSLLVLGAAACGDSADANEVPGDAPGAACPVGDVDCFETGADPGADPAGGTCLAGDIDCFETGAEQGDDPQTGMCVADVTDCVDAIDAIDTTDNTGEATDTLGYRCLPEAVGCVDTPGLEPAALEEARHVAQGLLGVAEDELPLDVRVSRRGDEQFAVTEDYVIGRSTVELDDTDGSGYRVVFVALETPDGNEAYELTPG